MSCRHVATYDSRADADAAAFDKRVKAGTGGARDKGWASEGCPRCHRFIVTTRQARENRRQRANRRS